MKLVTYLHDGKEAVGVLREDGAAVRPLPFPDMNALIEAPRSQLLSAVKKRGRLPAPVHRHPAGAHSPAPAGCHLPGHQLQGPR